MEELRAKQHDSQNNSAFVAKGKRQQATKGTQGERKANKITGKCFKRGKAGHWKRDCKSKVSDACNVKPVTKSEDRGAAFVGQIVSATTVAT
ncbi:unnamed protein product [Lasius platythorax]|uniref:CCHC-type domain-containing protein n=1 Tax=Lasius platythorax TaxID=488582 RepID=A0AAV2P6R9_9HYME